MQYYTNLKAYEEKSLRNLKEHVESQKKFSLALSEEERTLLETL
jgi:hypothetical protein